nr:hypothetical protein Iba_chr02aCG18420 [Ipomoea batatas]
MHIQEVMQFPWNMRDRELQTNVKQFEFSDPSGIANPQDTSFIPRPSSQSISSIVEWTSDYNSCSEALSLSPLSLTWRKLLYNCNICSCLCDLSFFTALSESSSFWSFSCNSDTSFIFSCTLSSI